MWNKIRSMNGNVTERKLIIKSNKCIVADPAETARIIANHFVSYHNIDKHIPDWKAVQANTVRQALMQGLPTPSLKLTI